eukprot:1139967-Pelagomonas_calceolata.AAC.9
MRPAALPTLTAAAATAAIDAAAAAAAGVATSAAATTAAAPCTLALTILPLGTTTELRHVIAAAAITAAPAAVAAAAAAAGIGGAIAFTLMRSRGGHVLAPDSTVCALPEYAQVHKGEPGRRRDWQLPPAGLPCPLKCLREN